MVRPPAKMLGTPSLIALTLLVSPGVGRERLADQQDETNASQLVATALQFELDGDNQYRELTLKAAAKEHPDFKPARWQLGFVQVNDDWVPASKLSDLRSSNSTIRAYQAMRGSAIGDAEGELALARWCRRNDLPDVAQVHLNRVLRDELASIDQRNTAAELLELRAYGDQLITAKEFREKQQAERAALQAWKSWANKIDDWRQAIESDNSKRRERALAELRSVSSAEAIPALESLLSPLSAAYALEVVKVLSSIDERSSTESLVRHAVGAPWEQVVDAAASALKQRPKHEYVPVLLDALERPLLTRFTIRQTPGRVIHEQVVVRETEAASFVTRGRVIAAGGDPTASAGALMQARNRAAQIQREVDSSNQRIASSNERVIRVLQQATGEILRQDTNAWWQWWDDYNDNYIEDRPKPTYVSTSTTVLPQISTPIASECFPAGTLVWTEQGLLPIESVQPGDRLVSQDAATGELALRPVTNRTTRPPVEVMSVKLDGQTIIATKGHPFWVNGQGWIMARHLEPGMQVHTMQGGLEVKSAERLPERQICYNLLVDGFGTYFVSPSAVLVHDGTDRNVPPVPVPGLVRRSLTSAIAQPGNVN